MRRFELFVEIDERDIEQYAHESGTPINDAVKEITNTMYLGLSCIDGMLARQFEITNIESYVRSIDQIKIEFLERGGWE